MKSQAMSSPVRARIVLAAAVASGAILALPSTAPAHETGEHAPVMANCPSGGPAQNAVCFALRGVEYSVRHGGTAGAAQELRENTATNVDAYGDSVNGAVDTYKTAVNGAATGFATTMVSVGTTFRTSVELAADDLETALDAGIANALLSSDGEAAEGIGAVQAFATSDSAAPCPVNPPTPVFPQTLGALRALSCAIWAALPTDTSALTTYIAGVEDAVGGISTPFADALIALRQALEQSTEQLAGDTTVAAQALQNATATATEAAATTIRTATETAGANQVLHAFYAAQCVRKGDYGPFTRPTPCPQ